MQQLTRNQKIVRTGVVGILANVLLAVFKSAVGILSNSIAIILDAINNLSDALSSIIIIVGTKLALKPANKNHPLGYGRVEYLSAMLISGIVLLAGATSLVEAVKKIIDPVTTNYSAVTLTVIVVAIYQYYVAVIKWVATFRTELWWVSIIIRPLRGKRHNFTICT